MLVVVPSTHVREFTRLIFFKMASPVHVKQLRANVRRILILCSFLILFYLDSFINASVHIHCDDLVQIGDQRQGQISRKIAGTLLSYVSEQETTLLSVWKEINVSIEDYEWFADNATIFLRPTLKHSLYSFRIHYPLINMTEEYYLSGPWQRREEKSRSIQDWITMMLVAVLLFVMILSIVVFIIYTLLLIGVVFLTKYE
jgi:hypothetical protein